jgi:hypothetical protein
METGWTHEQNYEHITYKKESENQKMGNFLLRAKRPIFMTKLFKHTKLKVIFQKKNLIESHPRKKNILFYNSYIFRSTPIDMP